MQPPRPLHRRLLERAVRTEPPCPSPTCPHLSHAQAPTIPLIIPGSFSQVIPKANHSPHGSPNPLPAPEHQTLTNQTQNQGPGPGEDMQGTGAVQLSMGELPQATGMGCLLQQPQLQKDLGTCPDQSKQQSWPGREGQRGPRCRWHIKDRMQAQHEHRAPHGASRIRAATGNRSAEVHGIHQPVPRRSLREGTSHSGKSKGPRMLSSSQTAEITQESKCHHSLNSQLSF